MDYLLEALPASNAFRPYVAMLKESGSVDISGIVEKAKITEQTPPEFITKTGNFDLFLALKYIREHPEDSRWTGVKEVLRDEMPSSCEAMSTGKKSSAIPSDYISSLLWLMY